MSDNEERAGEQTGCGGARPEVTLVVTAHNMEDCLGEALASLAAQTFGDFRAIVVEDGSLDGTYAVAEAFCASDGRFSVVRTEGLGAAGARTRGLEVV
ncbi:glycosyltransferase family 2 protein [Rubneribacter sp.]